MVRMLTVLVALATGCGDDDPPVPPPDGGAPDTGTTDAGTPPPPDAGVTPPCDGEAGTFRSQSIEVEGEARFYYLHVPARYDCRSATPVLVDFHGTAGDQAEEAYGLEAVVALADAEGFIVVRPRSRPRSSPLGDVYQWDANPGDPARNVRFVQALLAELGDRYHLDPDRTYAAGFSSGTNMASQFLTGIEPGFDGYGLIGGGWWTTTALLEFTEDAPRIFAATGHRDYMLTYLRPLLADLEEAGYPGSSLFVRETDAGHELYGWHYVEMWAWLDRGERPPPGSLAAGWSRIDSGVGATLLEVARAPDGVLVASGAEGTVVRVDPVTGDAEPPSRIADGFAPSLPAVCIGKGGVGLATGEGVIARTRDAGRSWEILPRAPEHGTPMFGFSQLNALGCLDGGGIVGGGYWTGIETLDAGDRWGPSTMIALYEAAAQVAALEVGPSGTVMSVGYYDYAGRRAAGETDFTAIRLPAAREWYYDAASGPGGRWWIAGERGALYVSGDDGRTFADRSIDTDEDLFAIDFADADVGLAVGTHGAAFRTEDGGASWVDVSTGLDGFLGDVVLLDRSTAIAVGEAGAVLRFTAPP